MPTTEHAAKTYSLPEAALIICGDTSAASITWLVRRLRGTHRPALNGYKVGRRWRMTEHDIDHAITLLRPAPPHQPPATSLTRTSQRRLQIAATS